MKTIKTLSFLIGLGILSIADSCLAQNAGNLSDTSGINVSSDNVNFNNSSGALNASFNPDTSILNVQSSSGQFSLNVPQSVVNTAQPSSPFARRSSGSTSTPSQTQGTERVNVPTVDSGDPSNPLGGSQQVLVCLTKPCIPTTDTETTGISLNEIAELLKEDLNQSLDELAAAERYKKTGIPEEGIPNIEELERGKQPRRFSRQANSEDCGCVGGNSRFFSRRPSTEQIVSKPRVDPTIEARQTLEEKLQESERFIEQVDSFKPENSIW